MSKKLKALGGVLLSSLLLVGCAGDVVPDESKDKEPEQGDVTPGGGEVTPPEDDPGDVTPPEDVPEDFSNYEEVSQGDKMLFPRQNSKVGDPMPFYEDGVLWAYFLDDVRKSGDGGFHPVSLLKTEDFLNYEEYSRVIPFDNSKSSIDNALGTGSCIRAKDGKYHFWYTGHNSGANTGLPYYEKMQHAISDDKIHWTKLNDGFFGDTNDFRDPHVVYIEELDEYWMLVSQLKNALGQLHWYKSNDLYTWTDAGTYYSNTKGFYNMECSTLIKFKGYWYLTFNEQGTHRVMHYRYKKNLNDEWIVPEIDYIDDEGLYAAKLCGDDNRLFAYGWLGTKGGSRDTGGLGWGGNLVGHELYQKENGELGVKPIQEVFNDVSHRYPHKTLDSQEIVTEIDFETAGYNSTVFEPFKANRYSRLSFDFTPKSKGGYAGLMFNTADKDEAGNIAYMFDGVKNTVTFYNNIKSKSDFGDKNFEIPFTFQNGQKIHIDFFYENQSATMYVNGERALTDRVYSLKGKSFSIFAKDKKCSFENIKFYE